MLIKLPPGMTPEQYWKTPEGQATAERQEQGYRQGWPVLPPSPGSRPGLLLGQGEDYQSLTIADDRPPRPTKYTYSPPGDSRRSPITRPRQPPSASTPPNGPPPHSPPGWRRPRPDGSVLRRPPELPVVPLPAYAGAGARPRGPHPGQAQPKADPYEAATPAPMDTFQEIFEALEEMAPDLPSHQRRAVARSLAEEYRRERMDAMDSLRPPVPMAEPTEQMEFDQAYSDMQDVGRAEDRMKARMEDQLREERVAEMNKNQLEQRRANAQQGRAGVVGGRPQWQMDGQRPDARGNAPAGAATGPRPGMPGVGPRPTPGMAQPIPPASQGDPLGGRSEQEMYWELVDGGMSPAEAAKAVRDAFAYMPR
jgi:hypothetical protein